MQTKTKQQKKKNEHENAATTEAHINYIILDINKSYVFIQSLIFYRLHYPSTLKVGSMRNRNDEKIVIKY